MIAATLALAALACPAVPPEPEPDPEPAPDTSGVLFEPERVIEVAIEIAEGDWDELRFQSRSIVDIFGGDCLAQPFADPFSYFPATVTVDGEVLADVGVRKKGFLGSLSSDKPSLKLKLDEFVAGQRVHGLPRLTLNNNAQDPSAIRQCLGYGVFARAGVPAPRCNFAHVTVNGVDLGVFTHVESMDKHLIGRHFDDDNGDLWEGTLSDFRASWTGTFEKKTNEADVDKAHIDAVTVAAGAPDAELIAELEAQIDLDGFFALWATESLVGHWDGYGGNTNNFYLYDDPTSGLLHFLPWGIDQTFVNGGGGETPPAVTTVGVLAHRLLDVAEGRERYASAMRRLLDDAWDEAALDAEIDRMTALIEPLVPPETLTAIGDVRGFVDARRDGVTAALDAGLAPVTEPLRDAFCFELIGDVDVTFATTWGTIVNDDIFNTGSGTLAGTVRGNAIVPAQVGSRGGGHPEQPGRVVVQVFGAMPDQSIVAAAVELDEAQLAEGTVELDGEQAIGYLVRFVPATGANELLGLLLAGTLTLSAASTDEGAAFEGSIVSELYWFPF
ncbi:MAG: hypothetical protein A2138_19225 [Deltaproteobacteria bacterium RBG_16_71_12]|nr:MAG: hypothetical protein A2138_19225 [Deltaproteobacteria bacterium RBG_16_71_12]